MTLYQKLSNDFAHNYIGYSALGIVPSTTLGSVAVMTTLMHGHTFYQMAVVFAIVVCSMSHTAAILTVQKPQVVFNLLLTSLAVSLMVIIGAILI
ncbi:MAG: hypothetical protein V7767_03810 [Leeuwenhoekiella sp.]